METILFLVGLQKDRQLRLTFVFLNRQATILVNFPLDQPLHRGSRKSPHVGGRSGDTSRTRRAGHTQVSFPHLPRLQEVLTQRSIVTEFLVVTFKPFLCSPAIVSTFNNDVDFFKPVLSHVPAEHPTSPLARDRVPSVHGTAPHVSDSIGVDGGVGPWLRDEWIVQRDTVPPAL